MALVERYLDGDFDRVAAAIETIRLYASQAVKMNPKGYWVAFSGGKDSIVILDLIKRAEVTFEAHFRLTTVDPPELLRFIREYHPDVIWHRPKIGMFKLIRERLVPPTRLARYCCEHLKETGGMGYFVVLGIRRAESNRRRNRQVIESCMKPGEEKSILNPILDWQDADVWEYIRSRGLPYCKLYDEGFKRIGCVMCPMAGSARMISDSERWPRFKRAYLRAFEQMLEERKKRGLETDRWDTAEDVFTWWTKPDRERVSEDIPDLFEYGGNA